MIPGGPVRPGFSITSSHRSARFTSEENPTREQLRAFHQQHGELLNFPILWIDGEMRNEIAAAVADAIHAHNYTCYACAICGNHLHLVIRTHKHKAREQWNNIADSIRQRLRGACAIASLIRSAPITP
jgi:hypothetical protein